MARSVSKGKSSNASSARASQNSPRPSLAVARSGSCHPPTIIEPMESCGFATQTSSMSGPPNSSVADWVREGKLILWPEALARGSRSFGPKRQRGEVVELFFRLGPTIFTRRPRHALHSLSLVQGRATRVRASRIRPRCHVGPSILSSTSRGSWTTRSAWD